jgi:ornithine cyclodeaminase
MGSDQAGKNEIDPAALAAADLYVCDRVSQAEKLGELRSAIDTGVWKKGKPAELGDVVAGAAAGRKAASDVTLCDLTGTGAQDTAIATQAFTTCRAAGTGALIAT